MATSKKQKDILGSNCGEALRSLVWSSFRLERTVSETLIAEHARLPLACASAYQVVDRAYPDMEMYVTAFDKKTAKSEARRGEVARSAQDQSSPGQIQDRSRPSPKILSHT